MSELMNITLPFRQAMVLLIELNGINLAVWVLATVLGFSFFASLSTLALIEAALLMLIAGGADISSSIFMGKARQLVFGSKKDWSVEAQKASQQNAARYLIAGVLLLAEAILLSKFS